MIMPKGQQLLMPASPVFIAASLVLALALVVLPFGRVQWMPDWLLLLLVFWGLHQPQRVGLGLAFVLGLVVDVQQGVLLGQHALAYSVLMFAVHLARRRLLWFNPLWQALQLLPLLAGVQLLLLALRVLAGGLMPGWAALLAPLLEAVLWPLVSGLLLAPQRRPPDQDANRPL